ncbi:MAG: MATE family efflux transporter [Oscillospiraceae bacterium]|nr:MATE family efflux transporter [Oscillospiraceae bacterium]MDD7279412.1 MATE family efflux transporter [Oscillospiraceae bacterium]MDY2864297.1 MATE family efflux transporter [Oscillospiraceae bacterium]
MRELTSGKPAGMIFAFALPIALGSLFQQLYSMIDTVIVGRTIGVDAIAALGSTSYISNLIIGFMSGLTNGFAIITARHFGAGDHVKMRRSVAGTIILGLAVSAVFTVLSMVFLRPFLRILNTPAEIFDTAYSYISVILIFMTTAMLYNMSAGVLRAVGDSVTPLVFLIISSFINIGLDILFIAKLGFGVKGAAYATVISQSFSFIMCCIYICIRFPYLIPKREEFRVTLSELGELMAMGLSLALMFSIVEIGSLILQRAINNFGTATIAAHTAARKISSILMLPYSAFGSACATYCSQNLGAGRPERVGKGIKSAIFMCWVWSAMAVIVGYLFSPAIVSWIAGTDETFIVGLASKYMRVNTPFYFILAVLIIMRSSLQGLGRKSIPVASSIIEMIGKAVVAFAAAPVLGYFGVMISEPIVWFFMTVLLVWGYARDKELVKATFVSEKA